MAHSSIVAPDASRPVSVAAPGSAADAKSNNFNFLRLLLAVVVIFSHARPLLYGMTHLDPVAAALHNQLDQVGDHAIDAGHLAVYGFFVISGYLISMSFVRSRGVLDYLKKRVLRIYPGFLVAVTLCAVLFGPLGAIDRHAYGNGLLRHPRPLVVKALNLSADWNAPPFVNTLPTVPIPHAVDGSLWTIRYEFLCYLMVAALGVGSALLARRVPHRVLRFFPALLFLLAYTLYAGLLHGHFAHWADRLNQFAPTAKLLGGPANIPRLFVYFIAGMCFYAYRRHVPFNTPLLIAALAALAASAWLPPLLPLTLPLLGSYALLSLAFAPWLRLSRVGTKNDLSYGIYLYAFPVQQLLVMYFGPHLTPGLEFAAALPPTILLAWLSWNLVEKPALRLKGSSSFTAALQKKRQAGRIPV